MCVCPVFYFSLSLGYIHFFFFFFNDTATTEIYTLSLTTLFRSRHAARARRAAVPARRPTLPGTTRGRLRPPRDRKSTRLNSSHGYISYAVFCLKKKKKNAKY